ncbi:MAG: DUF126 domain-containing protein [Thermoplasmata archaeon]|nr:DUF126 domain-containing protein [Thermoplasmata archaeon]
MHGGRTDREAVQEDRLGLGQGYGISADPWKTEGDLQNHGPTLGGDITIIKGRCIRAGIAKGPVLASSIPLSFLGGVDSKTGRILDPECECRGKSVSKTVLAFPYGKGSTVGSYSMYQLKIRNASPAAIVNTIAEPIVATGAIIAGIPMIDGIDVSLLRTSDKALVDAESGSLELRNVEEKQVVTNILRHKGKILLLQRSVEVGSYRGLWAGVSGFIEPGEDPKVAAKRELEEEVSLKNARMARSIDPQSFRDGDVVWTVHSFLFDVRDPQVSIDWEHQGYEWVSPEDVGRFPTVPGLQKIVCKLLS